MSTSPTVMTKGLGKRYKSFWALENCDISLPPGSVTALVGPNGAGKSTLLKILVGLSQASSGEVSILGKPPIADRDFLSAVGYLAQEIPLYKSMNSADHIAMGQHLNGSFDEVSMKLRLSELEIPLNKPVGKLSGGQRAQVALALALAKKPKLLLLDEPVAALDPLARHDFLAALAQAVADGGLTVIMSSHLLADLERVSDHLIVMASGNIQLCDEIQNVLKDHRILTGPSGEPGISGSGVEIIQRTDALKQSTQLVRISGAYELPAKWLEHQPNIEEIILAYMARKRVQSEGEQR